MVTRVSGNTITWKVVLSFSELNIRVRGKLQKARRKAKDILYHVIYHTQRFAERDLDLFNDKSAKFLAC